MTSTRAWAIAARYGRAAKRQSFAAVALAAVVGCASADAPSGPATAVRIVPWSDGDLHGREVQSSHYRVHTTVADDAVIGRFVRVLETAHAQYETLLPPGSYAGTPLDVYFFATPAEWDAFTRRLTGPEAAVYLSVGPGGYAFGDRFVCWLFNESDLWSVVAHEGFHQYVARHLTQRLPPAVEEGLATTFESVTVTDRSVSIDRRSNPRRRQGLAEAAAAGALLPIDTLVRLHAGDVAGRELVVREGFYGQCWAVARVMLDTPSTADGLRRMLADLRDGRAGVSVGDAADRTAYRPSAVRPLLEKYVAPDWAAFARAVDAFARQSTDPGRPD